MKSGTPSERIAQTYDENGNVILHYHEYWDGNTNQWKFQDKEKYEIVITEIQNRKLPTTGMKVAANGTPYTG